MDIQDEPGPRHPWAMLRDWLVAALTIPLDMLRPIAPWDWRFTARQLARAPGWVPPMALVAALGTLLFSHGLLGKFVVFHALHMATVAVVSIAAMYLVARQAGMVLRRYGVWGVTRSRWWFEIGRLLWITCVVSFAAAIGPGFAGLGNVGPFGDAAFRGLMRTGACAFVAFAVVATVAYLLSFVLGWRRRGRAFECVQFFYGMILAGILAGVVGVPAVVLFQADRLALVALGVAAFAAGCAGVVALVQAVRQARSA